MSINEEIRKKFQENVEAVSEIMKGDLSDYRECMEELGYQWVDDGTDEIERREEETACPQNDGEKRLVGYFEGESEPDDEILQTLFDEQGREETNFPLFRKYFRNGNTNLKNLILYGLKKNPNNDSLLMALVYFNEYHLQLRELCDYFIKACVFENNPEAFRNKARYFWIQVEPFHYDALAELSEIFPVETPKGRIVRELMNERDGDKVAIIGQAKKMAVGQK